MAGIPKTQDSVEGWHRSWNSTAGTHPNLWKFIEQLRLEQSTQETRMANFPLVEEYQPQREVEDRNNLLAQLLPTYTFETALPYVRAVGNALKLQTYAVDTPDDD